MNDPIKNFIQQNKEEFDNIEPSSNVLGRVIKDIKIAEISGRRKKIQTICKWSVAATILITFSIYFYHLPKERLDGYAISKNTKTVITKSGNEILAQAEKSVSRVTEEISKPIIRVKDNRKTKERKFRTALIARSILGNESNSILSQLSNDNSSSSRIDGLIKANKLSEIDENLIEAVVERAIEDENSNVRMAAVDVIVSRLEQPHMGEKLIRIFVEQDDPFVQNQLIDLIATQDKEKLSQEVKDKLADLTKDPATMDFVKDKSYAVLLRQ